MIMYSYLNDMDGVIDEEVFKKHLDLLRVRYDPNAFTHETVHEYRVFLFTSIQEELDDWNGKRLIRTMVE